MEENQIQISSEPKRHLWIWVVVGAVSILAATAMLYATYVYSPDIEVPIQRPLTVERKQSEEIIEKELGELKPEDVDSELEDIDNVLQ